MEIVGGFYVSDLAKHGIIRLCYAFRKNSHSEQIQWRKKHFLAIAAENQCISSASIERTNALN